MFLELRSSFITKDDDLLAKGNLSQIRTLKNMNLMGSALLEASFLL